jgi:hypothetical protein
MLDFSVSIKYMLAGYSVFLAIPAVYLISLVVRWHTLQRDLETLKEIQNKNPK